MNIEQTAAEIVDNACSFYEERASMRDEQYTMYSYDHLARYVIQGIAQQLLEQGATQAEVVKTLQSKAVRHGLDVHHDYLVEAGKAFAKRAL